MPESFRVAERGGQGAAVGDGDGGHDVPPAVVPAVTASLVTVPAGG